MEGFPAVRRAESLWLATAAVARLKWYAAIVAGPGLCEGGGWSIFTFDQAAELICLWSPVILPGRGASTFGIGWPGAVGQSVEKLFGLKDAIIAGWTN
jgi:hypothetical protein